MRDCSLLGREPHIFRVWSQGLWSMEKVVIFHFRKEKSRLQREEPCDKDCMAQEGRKETFQGSRHWDPCPVLPSDWSGLWWISTGHLKGMNGKWADGIQSVSVM